MALTRKDRTTNAVESNSGRYTQGGLTDRYQRRLGWWERFPLERQTDDLHYVVSQREAGRPDLIAFDVYRRANLMWLVLQYNNIVDVNEEIIVGKRLTLPTPRRLSVSILTNTTGGNVV